MTKEDLARPGRPAQIDLVQIVRAALAVIDREGIDGCTMRAVASELGVTAMALYRHVANKEQLLSEIPDLLLVEVADAVCLTTNAMDALRTIALGLNNALVAHSGVVTLFLKPVPGPNMGRAADHTVALLAKRSITFDEAFELIRIVVALVIGQVFTSHGGDHTQGIDLLLSGIDKSLRRRH